MGVVRIAVIQFPGTNCEYETQRAIASTGVVADIVSWQLSVAELIGYDGVVIAGGFVLGLLLPNFLLWKVFGQWRKLANLFWGFAMAVRCWRRPA